MEGIDAELFVAKSVQLNDVMMKMFENSTEAMFFFNKEGKIILINPAAEKIVDLEVLELLKTGANDAMCNVCRGYTSDVETQTCDNCYLTSSQSEDFASFQVYLDTKEKGLTPYAATLHTIDFEKDIRVFILRDLSTQFETQKKSYQNMMMKHIIDAQENERKRISRELHDSVAQELLSAVVDLRTLKYITTDKKILNKTTQTTETLTRLLDDIRNLSVELRPAALDDFGLEAAFRAHFKRILESYGLNVNFISEIEKKRYSSEIETVCYRVCQEALLNAIKYAEVEEVKVSLFEKDNSLQLVMQDFGTGFIKGGSPLGTGLGLYGMSERAELVYGKVQVVSELGKGTTVHLRVPI